ncbi:MAG TPA: hypothetical protein VF784_05165 [Anaerolineales bacterium]
MEREQPRKLILTRSGFPLHGWVGLALALVFWAINWTWVGLRTYWAFFPMWLGYCLTVDALVFMRTGTSLLARDWRKYVGLFLVSAPIWWIFEALNLRTQNWTYTGVDGFSPASYAFWTTLSFTTVVPAVFGSTELIASVSFLKGLRRGPIIKPNRATTLAFFVAGWLMLALLLIWPNVFFPFIWLAPFFIIEPLNVWLRNRSLADWTRVGDWRPVIALWSGVLLTAFFWEMWNYLSYPKWIYHVAWGGWLHVFEMPLLGYGGYLPFALELYAFYALITGMIGQKQSRYVRVHPEPSLD